MTAGYMDMNDLTSAETYKFMREGFKKIGMTDEQAGETVNMIVKTTAEKSAELLDYCFDELEKAPEMVRNGIFLNMAFNLLMKMVIALDLTDEQIASMVDNVKENLIKIKQQQS